MAFGKKLDEDRVSMNGITLISLEKETQVDDFSLSNAKLQREQTRKRILTRHWICQHSDFSLPNLQNLNKCLV
jgi:hypothetical protein